MECTNKMNYKTILLLLLTFHLSTISAINETSYFGVNIAGAEFGSVFPGTYNVDYVYPSTKDLDYFKTKGLKLIRLPIKWERIQRSLNGNLDQSELNRLNNFIINANSRELLVIIDLHNYGRRSIDGVRHIIGSSVISVNHIKDLWFRLSDVLKVHSNIWGYGLMNEPHDMLASPSWYTISQEIIDIIRTTDTKTNIIVGGDSWSSAERWNRSSDNLKNLVDPENKLIFEAHVYFDSDASGQYAKSYDADGANPNIGVNRVAPFVQWLKDNNLRGFIGEYGVPKNDARWLVVLDNFLKYLQLNCINGTYWAAGAWWGNYSLSIQPQSSVDAPQMSVLEKYKSVDNCVSNTSDTYENRAASLNFKVFPNPFFNYLEIENMHEHFNTKYIFRNLTGDVIFSGEFSSKTHRIDCPNLPSGVYFIQLHNNSSHSYKIIKKQ